MPAVQAAREAARRLQCSNQLKQMGLAFHTHLDAQGVFPTGGNHPWPPAHAYLVNGNPESAKRQGLGWAYQILPYVEQEAVYKIPTQAALQKVKLGIYFCPSRRRPTIHQNGAGAPSWGDAVLMDYAGATPGRITVSQGVAVHQYDVNSFYWQGGDHCMPRNTTWNGIIVRTNLDAEPSGGCSHLYTDLSQAVTVNSAPDVTTPGDVRDGLSNTLMVGEKRLNPGEYASGAWHDDRGWTDGWDPDIMRSTAYPAGADTDKAIKKADGSDFLMSEIGYMFGSAHSGAFNTCFGDGSVHSLSYSIDRHVFDCLGDRRDGVSIDGSKF